MTCLGLGRITCLKVGGMTCLRLDGMTYFGHQDRWNGEYSNLYGYWFICNLYEFFNLKWYFLGEKTYKLPSIDYIHVSNSFGVDVRHWQANMQKIRQFKDLKLNQRN